MGKPQRKHRLIPAQLQQSTTPVDLFVVAGLPNPIHLRAEEFLGKIGGAYAKVISSASQTHDGRRLYRDQTIETLLRSTTQFATRRLKNRSDDQSTRPRRIALFYVPAEDDERLLEAFDFFVFPIPLRDLAGFGYLGKQLRYDRQACEQALQKAVEVYKKDLIGTVQQRIESRKSAEPLLLPPVNFHIRDQRLKHVFCELTRGVRSWHSTLPEGIKAETFDGERLPNFLQYQERQLIFRDARNVVFPCARSHEMHGAQEINTDTALPTLRDVLRSTYRFGMSLPQGFHHDAQLEDGRDFNQMSFECSRQGPLSVSASHANIFPNDFVNPAQ